MFAKLLGWFSGLVKGVLSKIFSKLEGADIVEAFADVASILAAYWAPLPTAMTIFGVRSILNGGLWWTEKNTSRIEIMITVVGVGLMVVMFGLNPAGFALIAPTIIKLTAGLSLIYQLWLGPIFFEKSSPARTN